MALKHAVGTLFIVCIIIFHVECAPRIGRDDDSGFENGSGSEDPDTEPDDEYNDVGAADADYSSEEDPEPKSSQPTRPENPIDYEDDVGYGKEVTKNKPATTSMATVNVDKDDEEEVLYSEEDDDAYEDEDDDVHENGFVSINNNNVVTGQMEKPTISNIPKNDDQAVGEVVTVSDKPNERDMLFGGPVKPEVAENDDKDVYLDLGEDAGSRDKPNERDMFFGRPDPVKPEVAVTGVGLVGIGVQKTDVMLVFDEDGVSDDSQIEDPEILSLERGDYKKDDFFDTIGMKKLDDFIPKATETKKAKDFIEGHSITSSNMNDIFGASNGGKTMKDDFFDSIAVKYVVSDKVDSQSHAYQANNQVGAFVMKTDTQGPDSGLADDEELTMKRVILKALQLFMDSPCDVGARFQRYAKCAVLQDVLKALTISGLTFGVEKKFQKPKYTAKPWMKHPSSWVVPPHVLMRS